MSRAMHHKQITIPVLADVDVGIAPLVAYLNAIPGVRTHTSCQGGKTYRPYVMVSWDTKRTFNRLSREFDTSQVGKNWCYVHPKDLAHLTQRP